jgi:hypothetical protein
MDSYLCHLAPYLSIPSGLCGAVPIAREGQDSKNTTIRGKGGTCRKSEESRACRALVIRHTPRLVHGEARPGEKLFLVSHTDTQLEWVVHPPSYHIQGHLHEHQTSNWASR